MDKKPTVYVQVPYMYFFVIFNSYLVDPDPEKKSEKPNHCDVSGSSFEKLRQAYGTTSIWNYLLCGFGLLHKIDNHTEYRTYHVIKNYRIPNLSEIAMISVGQTKVKSSG
jgi:hypothetical protein